MASYTSFLWRKRVLPALGPIVGAGLLYKYISGQQAFAESLAKTKKEVPPPRMFGNGPAFVSLKLQSAEQVNHNTKRLRFEFPNEDAVSGLVLTSAVLTMSWPKGRLLPVLRPYTPVSPLDAPGHLDLLVKHYPSGVFSTHLHSLSPGDSLRFVMRIPGYSWTPNAHRSILLIAGGAGITPMYQLISGILANPEEQTKITLLYGANSDADVLLKREFDAFERQFPGRFRAVYTVSNPAPGSKYAKGYVTRELMESVTAEDKGDKVFLCGPPAMETALVGKKGQGGILAELGYKKEQVFKF